MDNLAQIKNEYNEAYNEPKCRIPCRDFDAQVGITKAKGTKEMKSKTSDIFLVLPCYSEIQSQTHCRYIPIYSKPLQQVIKPREDLHPAHLLQQWNDRCPLCQHVAFQRAAQKLKIGEANRRRCSLQGHVFLQHATTQTC